jgi:hypothetical protein
MARWLARIIAAQPAEEARAAAGGGFEVQRAAR